MRISTVHWENTQVGECNRVGSSALVDGQSGKTVIFPPALEVKIDIMSVKNQIHWEDFVNIGTGRRQVFTEITSRIPFSSISHSSSTVPQLLLNNAPISNCLALTLYGMESQDMVYSAGVRDLRVEQ
jgi:hypothetical protein